MSHHRAWLYPLILMIAWTPFSGIIDLAATRHFFYASQPPAFHSTSFDTFMYEYGVLPGQILCGLSVVALLLALGFKRYRPWLRGALLLVLTLAIGSGLIIHALLKEHWGRPRPKRVIEFGGTEPFRPYYAPHFDASAAPAKSFASGHCSMGFYFFALALVGCQYRKRWLVWAGTAIALLLGLALGWARVEQGGHFVSDVVASALIMWLTAYALYVLLETRFRYLL